MKELQEITSESLREGCRQVRFLKKIIKIFNQKQHELTDLVVKLTLACFVFFMLRLLVSIVLVECPHTCVNLLTQLNDGVVVS